jgi:CheY-like chemotaxis protein
MDGVGKEHRAAAQTRREELLSEVAHAFRTPLGVITGYVELLQLRDDPDFRAEALPRMDAAGRRLAEEIERLLSILESDSVELCERFLDARDVSGNGPGPSPTPAVPRGLGDPSGLKSARVVIVDDDDEIRGLLLRTLPVDGFELLEARDGREALALIARETPDLVLLDWNMPNASGGDVLAELTRRKLDVPVIVLTANDDPRLRQIAAAHKADVFLAKPFSPLELLRAIERLLA